MNSYQLSYECANKYGPLTWREVDWGISRELIGWDVVKSMAVERISPDLDQPNELAILSTDDPTELTAALGILASSEPQESEIAIRNKWLRIILADLFVHRSKMADPLGEVERIYADFGYPEEIAGFVRYMPPSDGYDPQRHTHQENIERLYRIWSHYVESAEN